MRALVQRVSEASVTVDGEIAGEIGAGLLVLVCAMRGDTQAQSEWLARKLVNLRIFADDAGRMNRSLADIGGAALIISQFTLAAETKGNRPGFSAAARPTKAGVFTSISPSRSARTESLSPTASSERT